MRHAQKFSASTKNVNDILVLNLECCKCPRMRFHCANGLAVLRALEGTLNVCSGRWRSTQVCRHPTRP